AGTIETRDRSSRRAAHRRTAKRVEGVDGLVVSLFRVIRRVGGPCQGRCRDRFSDSRRFGTMPVGELAHGRRKFACRQPVQYGNLARERAQRSSLNILLMRGLFKMRI